MSWRLEDDSLMVGKVALNLSVGLKCRKVLVDNFQTSLCRWATVHSLLYLSNWLTTIPRQSTKLLDGICNEKILKFRRSKNHLKFNFRSSNCYSNESLERLNLSSEDVQSNKEKGIKEEDELDDNSINEVVIQKEVKNTYVAVLLEFRNETHEGCRMSRFPGSSLLKIGSQKCQSDLCRSVLQCQRIACQNFQLMQKLIGNIVFREQIQPQMRGRGPADIEHQPQHGQGRDGLFRTRARIHFQLGGQDCTHPQKIWRWASWLRNVDQIQGLRDDNQVVFALLLLQFLMLHTSQMEGCDSNAWQVLGLCFHLGQESINAWDGIEEHIGRQVIPNLKIENCKTDVFRVVVVTKFTFEVIMCLNNFCCVTS